MMSNPLAEGTTGSKDFTFGEQISMLFFSVEAGGVSILSIAILIGYKMCRTLFRTPTPRESNQAEEEFEDDAADSSLFMTLMVGEVLRAVGKPFPSISSSTPGKD